MRVPVLVALLALVAPAQAATFTNVELSDGRPAVMMAGDIAPGDDRRFSVIVTTKPYPDALVLTGEGGDPDAAMGIGSTLHLRGMETIVPAEKMCASACAFAWAAGTPTAVGNHASIGFHGAYLLGQATPQRSEAESMLVGIYLKRMGYSDAAADFMTSAAPQQMRWLSAEDAIRLRLRLVDASKVTMHPRPSVEGASVVTRSVPAK